MYLSKRSPLSRIVIFTLCCLFYVFIWYKTTISSADNESSVTTATPLIIQSKSIDFLYEFLPLLKTYFHGFGNGTIPKIVHITYKSTDLPIQYETFLTNCLSINPDVAFLFWTDSQVEKFIRQITRNSKLEEEKRFYRILTTYTGVEKADVFRLMVLYFIGGVYMDLDMECKISFTEIHHQLGQKMNDSTDEYSCLLDQEQWLQTRVHWGIKYCAMNNFMICRPFHAFFKYVLFQFKEDDQKTFIMDKTGPFLLTKRYEEFIDLSKRGNVTDKVLLAHPDWFSPLVDNVTHYEQQCKEMNNGSAWVQEGCVNDLPRYKNKIEEMKRNAFLIHHFLHLAYSFSQHLIKQYFSILSHSGVYVISLV